MKTNRFFLAILAVAGMMMTACSNDEAIQLNNEPQAISFRTQGGTPSSVLRTTATTTDYVDAFVVYGTDNVFGAANLIFDGVTVARQIEGGFDYAPKRYYGENAFRARFFAFSPVSTHIDNINPDILPAGVDDAVITFDYTVPKPNELGDTAQEDLLVAFENIAPSPDPLPDCVILHFTHALSRIFVTARNYTAETIVIDSLVLQNLVTKGTFAYYPYAAPDPNIVWTPSTDPDDVGNYTYILAESGVALPPVPSPINPSLTLPVYLTSREQGMMVLPQATVNDGDPGNPSNFALKIQYQFANWGTQTKYIFLPDGWIFSPNTQYTIHIEFTGKAIEFDIEVGPYSVLGLLI